MDNQAFKACILMSPCDGDQPEPFVVLVVLDLTPIAPHSTDLSTAGTSSLKVQGKGYG